MSSPRPMLVFGAGGHAKVVVAALQELGQSIAGLLDEDPALRGTELLGVRVSAVADYDLRGAPAILAIGDNGVRRRLAAELPCAWRAVVHPAASVHATVRLGEGAFVAAGAVLQPDVVVGDHAIVNTGATVDHDCVIGGFAHLAPGTHLAGEVSVGEGALVGLGAGITPGVRIGDWAVLGAGSMAVRDVPGRATAIGVPARVRGDG